MLHKIGNAKQYYSNRTIAINSVKTVCLTVFHPAQAAIVNLLLVLIKF